MPSADCPECDSEVHVQTFDDVGDTVECEECGAELVIAGIDPLELDVAEEEDPDYDDDAEDDL